MTLDDVENSGQAYHWYANLLAGCPDDRYDGKYQQLQNMAVIRSAHLHVYQVAINLMNNLIVQKSAYLLALTRRIMCQPPTSRRYHFCIEVQAACASIQPSANPTTAIQERGQ